MKVDRLQRLPGLGFYNLTTSSTLHPGHGLCGKQVKTRQLKNLAWEKVDEVVEVL
jgi:hypothetical protein